MTESAMAEGTVEHVIRQRLSDSLGGWRGSLETSLPTLAFVGVWMALKDVQAGVIASAVVVAILVVIRVLQRSSLRYALSAVLPTAVAAWFALRSGRAEDAFLGGLIWSAVFGSLTLVSVVTRYPLIGFVVGAADPRSAEDPLAWRRDAAVVRVCSRLTWVLVGVYAVRLGIMVPLYLAGNVPALGVAKVVLGWPLWLASVVLMGWMLVRGHTPVQEGRSAAD